MRAVLIAVLPPLTLRIKSCNDYSFFLDPMTLNSLGRYGLGEVAPRPDKGSFLSKRRLFPAREQRDFFL